MKRLLVALTALFCLCLPATALADYNPLSGACGAGGQAASSSACQPSSNSNDPISGKNGVLRKITNIVALIAGIAAVIMVIIGGFQFVTSGGDPQKAASARTAIIGALIGLIIVALAEAIVVFVLKGAK